MPEKETASRARMETTPPALRGGLDDVGEVELALRVVRRERGDGLAQEAARAR
jgi:hypothetical protein